MSDVMEEILPGVLHYSAFHERIGKPVHSYLVERSGTLIDPMATPEILEEIAARGAPRRIVLTNRHHLRGSESFVERFGCPVLCHEAGLHEFAGGPQVRGFSWGERLADDVVALEVGVLCPEESALRIDVGAGTLAIADAVVRDADGALAFVPDELLGEDPEAIKRGLRESFRRLLAAERFDALLLAHGAPVASGGRAELEAFAAAG